MELAAKIWIVLVYGFFAFLLVRYVFRKRREAATVAARRDLIQFQESRRAFYRGQDAEEAGTRRTIQNLTPGRNGEWIARESLRRQGGKVQWN